MSNAKNATQPTDSINDDGYRERLADRFGARWAERAPVEMSDWKKLTFHPFANIFPLMAGDDFDSLVEDIRRNLLKQPIVLYDGKILDGRNRHRAAIEAGVKLTKDDFKNYDGAEYGAKAYVMSANWERRHMTTEKKIEFAKKFMKENPDWSNRRIAELAKLSPTTVGIHVRPEVEAPVQHGQVKKRTGGDGKDYTIKAKVAGGTTQQPKNEVPAFVSEQTAISDHVEGFKIVDWIPNVDMLTNKKKLTQKQKDECLLKLATSEIVALLVDKDGLDDYRKGIKGFRIWIRRWIEFEKKPEALDAKINECLRKGITWPDVIKAYYKYCERTDKLPAWVA